MNFVIFCSLFVSINVWLCCKGDALLFYAVFWILWLRMWSFRRLFGFTFWRACLQSKFGYLQRRERNAFQHDYSSLWWIAEMRGEYKTIYCFALNYPLIYSYRVLIQLCFGYLVLLRQQLFCSWTDRLQFSNNCCLTEFCLGIWTCLLFSWQFAPRTGVKKNFLTKLGIYLVHFLVIRKDWQKLTHP